MTKTKGLCEICSPKQWKTISTDMLTDSGYPVYGANGVIGYYSEHNHEEPTILVTCRGATCGTLNICEPYSYVNGNAMALDNLTDEIDIKYLYYYLLNRGFDDVITGSAQPQIVRQSLQKVKVTYPDKERQAEIVSVLERVSKLVALRKEQLAKLDQLVKSRFIELFGTYPDNPMAWETGTIRDVVSDVRYGSSRPAVNGGQYPYLRMNNITYGGELDLTDTKRIDVPESELAKCTVRRGDVLFNRTNSKELVGKTCVYNRDEMMVLAGFVIRVRVTDRILPEFLSAFLNTDFSKKMLLGMCKAAIGQANINAQEMQNIGLYLPPIELQQRFVRFKEQTDKSKLTIQQSLDKLELLKKSLMQEYFG